MDGSDRTPDSVPAFPFRMPRLLVGLGAALVIAAAVASFSFTATLARVAGVSAGLAWLWPVVIGLTVAVIAYTYVMVAGLRYERITPLSWFYQLLLVGLALASIAGNVLVISRNPTAMGTLGVATVVSVPPMCLMACVCNYVVLAAIIPNRIVSSIQAAGLRRHMAEFNAVRKAFDASHGATSQNDAES